MLFVSRLISCLCVTISSRKKFSAGEGYTHQCIYYLIITVTHVVTVRDENMNCTRTMKCLYAVAKGIWLIDYQCMYMHVCTD